MSKFKVSKVPEELKVFADINKTKYDDLFEKKIIIRGRFYYDNSRIVKFKCDNKICDAVVEGTKNYNVRITGDEFYCSCPYHETNTYCKHIYAVLYKIRMDEVMLIYKDVIEKNQKTIQKVLDEINNNLILNKKLILKNDKKEVEKEISRVEKFLYKIDLKNNKFADIKYLEYQIEYETELIINYYERFNEYIKKRKKQKEQIKLDRLEEKRLEQECLEYEEDVYDPLFDKLDAYIESMPIEVLNQARQKTIEDSEDTSILDKAIKKKKQKEKEIIKNNKKGLFGMFIWNLLFDNKNTTKQEDIYNDYEPYNFEEEDLEEDDFYYEDLD